MLQTKLLSFVKNGIPLISNISLDFIPGILYGILGPNGSGKSTFLKTLTGIWQPTSGTVLWNEQEILKQSRKEISKTISLVGQNTPIPFDFTVLQLVEMGRYPHPKTINQAHEQNIIKWALQVVDGWHLRHRLVASLSNGEKQRIYIARALVTESPVLLLDEPTSSLDIRHQLEIWQLLKQLVEKGKIVIVTTHDLPTCERFCDEIAILNQGQCLTTGAFSSVMSPDLLMEVFGVTSDQYHRVDNNYVSMYDKFIHTNKGL